MKKMYFLVALCVVGNLFCSNEIPGIQVSYEAPSPEEFVALRLAAGLVERKIPSAKKGLPRSLFWVTLRNEQQELIGMGRVVGDGGTIALIADIAVAPGYQGKKYGDFIFNRIKEYILAEIPDDAFVGLFSRNSAVSFYQNRGFVLAQERCTGMYWPSAERSLLH